MILSMSARCIFCDIINGLIPASIVNRDAICTCFMDIQPVNPGHVLIVPNQHATHLADMPEETGAHLFRLAHRLSQAVHKAGVRCEGVNLFLADGEAAMQEFFHVHLHVFPRYKGDGFGLRFGDHYFKKPQRNELDDVAKKVVAVLGGNS